MEKWLGACGSGLGVSAGLLSLGGVLEFGSFRTFRLTGGAGIWYNIKHGWHKGDMRVLRERGRGGRAVAEVVAGDYDDGMAGDGDQAIGRLGAGMEGVWEIFTIA